MIDQITCNTYGGLKGNVIAWYLGTFLAAQKYITLSLLIGTESWIISPNLMEKVI